MKINEQEIKPELYEKLTCEEKAVLDSYGIKPTTKESEERLIEDLIKQDGIQIEEPKKPEIEEKKDLNISKVINKDNAKKVVDTSVKVGVASVNVANKFFDWLFKPSKNLTPKQLAKKRKELFG